VALATPLSSLLAPLAVMPGSSIVIPSDSTAPPLPERAPIGHGSQEDVPMKVVVVLFALCFMVGAPAVVAAQDLGAAEMGEGSASASAGGNGSTSGAGVGGVVGGVGGVGGGSRAGGRGSAAEPFSLGLTAFGLAGAAFIRRLVR
jgi:hypothetical protein